MGIADEMKKLKEEVLNSYKKRAEKYQQRLKDNEALVIEVQKTLDGFRKNHMEMAANIRANAVNLRAELNAGEVARLDAFGNLMGDIRESISSIQKEVEDIQNSTANLLVEYASSRGEMSEELNAQFAKARTDREKESQNRLKQNQERLKDFDALMKSIQEDINQSKAAVKAILTGAENLVRTYETERQEMSENLRKDLETNMEGRVAYTRNLLKAFHDRLTEIGKENREMAELLNQKLRQSREDLAADDAKRLSDFDQSMGEIRGRVTAIQNSIATMITNLSKDRTEAAVEWQGLTEAIAQIKNNMKKAAEEKQPQEAKVAEKKVKEEKAPVKNEKAPAEENEVVATEEIEIEISKEMSLEEKIVAYVNAHPEGVKVSEMEEPLGEQRMRIGYVCKKLLDAERITKMENAYFPKEKGKKKDK